MSDAWSGSWDGSFSSSWGGIPAVAPAELTGRGNWNRGKKSKRRRIKYSDLETVAIYEPQEIEQTVIIDPISPLEEDHEDDDALILAAVSRSLH